MQASTIAAVVQPPPLKRQRKDEGEEIVEEMEEVEEEKKKTQRDIIRTAETAKVADLLKDMEEFAPVIPDAVTTYFLRRTGFDCPDIRVTRLVSLAAQKFISDVASDALKFTKLRQQTAPVKDRDSRKGFTLTTNDLAAALQDHGVHVHKPPYYT